MHLWKMLINAQKLTLESMPIYFESFAEGNVDFYFQLFIIGAPHWVVKMQPI